jgi:hypothetical protein
MDRVELLERLVEEELKKRPHAGTLRALCKDLRIPWSEDSTDRMTLILKEMQSIRTGSTARRGGGKSSAAAKREQTRNVEPNAAE